MLLFTSAQITLNPLLKRTKKDECNVEKYGNKNRGLEFFFDGKVGWSAKWKGPVVPQGKKTVLMELPLDKAMNYKIAMKKYPEIFVERSKDAGEWDGVPCHEDSQKQFGWQAEYLYMFLLLERLKGEDSEYYDYIRLLPRDLSNFPLFYSDKELEELKGTNVWVSVHLVQPKLQSSFENLKEKFNIDFQKISLQDYKWAYTMVWSRAFPITYGDEKVPTLLPLIDILNHKYGADMEYHVNEQNVFQLITRESLQPGEIVYNNYGGKSNDSFLFSYGFTLPENSENTCVVQISASQENIYSKEIKNQLLKQYNLNQLRYYIPRSGFPKEMIQSFRILQCNEPEAYFFEESNLDFVSISNELNCIRTLDSLFRRKLKNMVGSLKQDQIKIHQYPRYSNMHNILTYRLGEYTIFHGCMHFLKRWKRETYDKYWKSMSKICQKSYAKNSVDSRKYRKYLRKEVIYSTTNTLIAIKPIKKHQVIMKMPNSEIITLKTMKKECIDPITGWISMSQFYGIVAWIFYQKFILKEKSRYFNFWSNLPEQPTTILRQPYIDEIERSGTFASVVLSGQEDIQRLHEFFKTMLPETFKKELSMERVFWCLIIKKQYFHTIGKDVYCVPIANCSEEFCNYQQVDIDFRPGSKDIVVRTICDLDSDEIISFRPLIGKGNEELLSEYGIVVKNNPYDYNTIQFDLDQVMSKSQLELCKKCMIPGEHFLKRNRLPKKLLALLCVFYMSPREIRTHLKHSSHYTHLLGVNDFRSVLESVNEVLNRFHSTLSETNRETYPLFYEFLEEKRAIAENCTMTLLDEFPLEGKNLGRDFMRMDGIHESDTETS